MASRTLRPLSIGEILDAGIKVVLRHWKVLAICVVGLVGPMNVLQVLVRASIDPHAFESGGATTTTTGDVGPALIGLLGSAILSGLAFLMAFTACFKAVADAWLGAEPEVGRSLRFGLRRLGTVLVAWIVWSIGLVLAFLALIVPGVYLGVAWCLTLPALLFEGIGPLQAMGRSRSLVNGRWWPALGLLLVGYLLVAIIGAIVQGLLIGLAGVSGSSVVPEAIATVIGATVSNAITTPYLAAVLAILYFDMRVRKEGFDLQLMAQDLGQPHDPDAPLPAPLVGDELTPEQKAAAPYWPPPPGWKPPPVGGAQPGWKPPVGGAQPAHAAWERPSPEPSLWRRPVAAPGPPPAAGTPGGRSPATDSSVAAPAAGAPGESSPATGAPRTPGGAGEQRASRGSPAPDDDERERPEPRRDPDRAGWLPPEAPRGPGGL